MSYWPVLPVVAICAWFAICFLQSSVDKIVDFKGNLDWLTGHFANSPFKGVVPFLLRAITVLELATGAACAVAIPCCFFETARIVPTVAMGLCCLSLISLFFGQRLAKDYAGAASLVPYFILAVFGLVLTV